MQHVVLRWLVTCLLLISSTEARSIEANNNDNEIRLSRMARLFEKAFSHKRSFCNPRMRNFTRTLILDHFASLGLEVTSQPFTSHEEPKNCSEPINPGLNLIGILPGNFRGKKGKDKVIVVGAHYDTVENQTPGTDDNGSGVVAILELARILSSKPKLNHTVIFVGYDLEEIRFEGSKAFVHNYLLPDLEREGSTFLGSFTLDMVMQFNGKENSQKIEGDKALDGLVKYSHESVEAIKKDHKRGNFIVAWAREDVDAPLYQAVRDEWMLHDSSYKFYPLFANPKDQYNPRATIARSDHFIYWIRGKKLPSILLFDMGIWRAPHGPSCYHRECDSYQTFVTKENLKFLKNTIDVMAQVISKGPKSGCQSPFVSLKSFVAVSTSCLVFLVSMADDW